MYRFALMPWDFRLSAWPQRTSAYATTFNTDRYNVDIKPILDYVEEQLRRTPVAFVFKTSFSLTNFYSSFTGWSVGAAPDPERALRRGALTFTFSRKRYPNAVESAFRFWQTGTTVIWGTGISTPYDFITVSIPMHIAVAGRYPSMMANDQRAIYNIVGGYTKAVIRGIKETPHNMTAKKNLFGKTIPRAMWDVAIADWKYVMEFWKRFPDMLKVNFSDPLFLEFYTREIAPNLPDRRRSKYYALYEEQCKEAWRSFILDFMQGTIKPEQYNLVSLMPDRETLQVEELALRLSKGILS